MRNRTSIILSVLFFSMVSFAYAQSENAGELLKQYISELQKNPDDFALREKIIKLVQEMKPAPTIPEEARRHFVMAASLQKRAKDEKGFELAVEEYRQALLIAPWWPEAYYNLGIALESANKYDDAIKALKLYLATGPKEGDAREAQDRIYAIEAAKKLARTEAAEANRPHFEGIWKQRNDMPIFEIVCNDSGNCIVKEAYSRIVATDVETSGNYITFIFRYNNGGSSEYRLNLSADGRELSGSEKMVYPNGEVGVVRGTWYK